MRIGCGYDSHRLVEGRRFTLGGIQIPFARGLEGWSDADVVTHAVIDAVCGAAGLEDIGTLFPAGDERYRDASSVHLLGIVVGMAHERGFSIVNVDVTIVAQEPVLAPYVPEMRRCLGESIDVAQDRISVKPKTNEHMGFVGRGEGVAAFAVVLLESSLER
ncbi:MAG: 2-C-methyl-D-erythritol 2,4-cyclodiphosphate synthase [Dehalococcoidia bacterium]|nr:MAG: 2-C-methyl-D-erythritol 2,4-cyclodiphosphate synthase [Dehalococcoidia bacterium]